MIETNLGQIFLELDKDNTPKTTENFLNYIQADFYRDTIFHRVIDGFMIQGGGFDASMNQKNPLFDPIENEAKQGKQNKRGSIAMARTSDPHSASAQFFINVKDNHFLNFQSETLQGFGYCVFGEVTQGMEVVDKIKAVKTGHQAGHQDVPKEAVVVHKVEILA